MDTGQSPTLFPYSHNFPNAEPKWYTVILLFIYFLRHCNCKHCWGRNEASNSMTVNDTQLYSAYSQCIKRYPSQWHCLSASSLKTHCVVARERRKPQITGLNGWAGKLRSWTSHPFAHAHKVRPARKREDQSFRRGTGGNVAFRFPSYKKRKKKVYIITERFLLIMYVWCICFYKLPLTKILISMITYYIGRALF